MLHAHDTLLKRDVAIKCIELSDNDAQRAGYVAAQAANAGVLDHAFDQEGFPQMAPIQNGALPQDPTFLDRREERQRAKQNRKAGRIPNLSVTNPASTKNINALAGVLPGTIAGAGQVEIDSIEYDGFQLPLIGAAAGDKQVKTVTFQEAESKNPRKNKSFAAAAHDPVAMALGNNNNNKATGVQAKWHNAYVPGATSIIGDTPNSAGPVAGLLATFPGLDEARAAAKLNDANIVTVYDCVVEGNIVYMIMEYVEGRPLNRVLRDLGNDITLDMIAAVFTSVAHALEVAHDSKILHLDIKPENVMISITGEVKVTDFGLATLMDASGKGTAGAGTIGYMPLEQMQQRALDVRTDEWALASLTYEMLSGSNPFRANSLKAAEAAINNAELVLPSQCWGDIDENIDDVMFMALDPNPVGRYTSIKKFDKALSPLLGDPKEGKTHLRAIMGGGSSAGNTGSLAFGEDGLGIDQSAAEVSSPAKKAGLFSIFKQLGQESTQVAFPNEEDLDESDGGGVGHFGKITARGALAQPIIDVIGPRGASIIMRIVAAAGCALLAAMALINMRISTSDMYGILSSTPIAFYVIVASQVVLAAIRPRWGVAMAYLLFALMLFFNFAWLQGVLMLVVLGVWWWFVARESCAASTVALLQPLCGSFGFAALAPVMAGIELDVRDALATASFAGFGAVMFAGLGSMGFNYWNAGAYIMLPGSADLASAMLWDSFVGTLLNPCTWLTFITWVAGAGLYSVLCRQGNKTFDIMGSVVCAAFLIAGEVVNVTLFSQPLNSLTLAGVIVSSLIGVLFAAINVPDRVRMAEGEW